MLFMNERYGKRHITVLLMAVMVPWLLCGCSLSGGGNDAAYVDEFSGKNIGVMLSWDSDYALTPRKDLNLVRYDAMPDMVMALKHDRLDAMALDELTAKSVEYMIQGIKAVKPGYGRFGYVAAFNPGAEDLCKDYNDFLKEYVESDEYADTQRRIAEFDGVDFEEAIIEPVGTGKIVRLAYLMEGYPSVYMDPETECMAGYDFEPLVRWANDRNYRLEMTGTTYNDMMMGVSRGRYDVAVGYVNELYEDDFSTFGIAHSDPINHLTNYFMIKTGESMSADSEFFDSYE